MKFALFLTLIMLADLAHAEEFRPNTIESMQATVHSTVSGTINGDISVGDSIEILELRPVSEEGKVVSYSDEQMQIGDEIIRPDIVEKDAQKYSSFKATNLKQYGFAPQFTISRTMHVNITGGFGVKGDYNLAKKITENQQYLMPTPNIESNDVTLVSKATLEFQSESFLETVREIAQWVHGNIEYDFEKYYSKTYSAKQTYVNRAGVCDEFANLTAAFLRIKGIPARYVSGISFDGKVFGNHGWVEAYSPATGWIAVDSTFGEAGYVDAAHIAFSKTEDANSNADFIIITKSVRPLYVETQLALPQVTIESKTQYSSKSEIKIAAPTKVVPRQEFDVNARIKNLSGEYAIFPIELAMHTDFLPAPQEELVLLAPDANAQAQWSFRAPTKDVSRGTYTYSIAAVTLDRNASALIKLVPGKAADAEGIIVDDVSPQIDGANISIKVRLINGSLSEKTAEVQIYGPEGVIHTVNETLAGSSILEKTYTITGVQTGTTIGLRVTADRTYDYQILIPKESAPVIISEQDYDSGKPLLPNAAPDSKPDLLIPAAIVAALAIGALVAFSTIKKL